MSKIHEKIMRTDFAKSLKKLFILALCVMLLGGGLSAAMLRTQIGDVVSNINQWRQLKENRKQNNENENQDYEGKEWKGENYDGNRKHNKDYARWNEREDRRGEDDFFDSMVLTKPTTAAVVTVGITIFFGYLFLFLFWLLIAAWMYQAAMRSGMSGLIWLAAGIIGNVYAAAVFLLVRSFIRTKCPSCGAFIPKKTQYCPKCGVAMNKRCENCGESSKYGNQFCHACGKQLYENNEKNEDNEKNE